MQGENGKSVSLTVSWGWGKNELRATHFSGVIMNHHASNVAFVGYPGEFIIQPIPLVETGVSAGFPSPADGYIDRALDLNELLITNPPATFFVPGKEIPGPPPGRF